MQGQLPGQQAPGQQMQPGMPGQMGWGGMQPGMQGVQGTQPGVQQGGTHQQVAYNAMAQQMPGQQMPGQMSWNGMPPGMQGMQGCMQPGGQPGVLPGAQQGSVQQGSYDPAMVQQAWNSMLQHQVPPQQQTQYHQQAPQVPPMQGQQQMPQMHGQQPQMMQAQMQMMQAQMQVPGTIAGGMPQGLQAQMPGMAPGGYPQPVAGMTGGMAMPAGQVPAAAPVAAPPAALGAEEGGKDWGPDFQLVVEALSDIEKEYYGFLWSNAEVAQGVLQGKAAFDFLSRSKVPREILKRIWSLCDWHKLHYLRFQEFVMAMKLIFAAQRKQLVSLEAVVNNCGPATRCCPVFEGLADADSFKGPAQPAAAPPVPRGISIPDLDAPEGADAVEAGLAAAGPSAAEPPALLPAPSALGLPDVTGIASAPPQLAGSGDLLGGAAVPSLQPASGADFMGGAAPAAAPAQAPAQATAGSAWGDFGAAAPAAVPAEPAAPAAPPARQEAADDDWGDFGGAPAAPPAPAPAAGGADWGAFGSAQPAAEVPQQVSAAPAADDAWGDFDSAPAATSAGAGGDGGGAGDWASFGGFAGAPAGVAAQEKDPPKEDPWKKMSAFDDLMKEDGHFGGAIETNNLAEAFAAEAEAAPAPAAALDLTDDTPGPAPAAADAAGGDDWGDFGSGDAGFQTAAPAGGSGGPGPDDSFDADFGDFSGGGGGGPPAAGPAAGDLDDFGDFGGAPLGEPGGGGGPVGDLGGAAPPAKAADAFEADFGDFASDSPTKAGSPSAKPTAAAGGPALGGFDADFGDFGSASAAGAGAGPVPAGGDAWGSFDPGSPAKPAAGAGASAELDLFAGAAPAAGEGPGAAGAAPAAPPAEGDWGAFGFDPQPGPAAAGPGPPVPPVAESDGGDFSADFAVATPTAPQVGLGNLSSAAAALARPPEAAAAVTSPSAAPAEPDPDTELHRLASRLAGLGHYEEAQRCGRHADVCQRVDEAEARKKAAVLNDELEAAIQIKSEITAIKAELAPETEVASWRDHVANGARDSSLRGTAERLEQRCRCMDDSFGRAALAVAVRNFGRCCPPAGPPKSLSELPGLLLRKRRAEQMSRAVEAASSGSARRTLEALTACLRAVARLLGACTEHLRELSGPEWSDEEREEAAGSDEFKGLLQGLGAARRILWRLGLAAELFLPGGDAAAVDDGDVAAADAAKLRELHAGAAQRLGEARSAWARLEAELAGLRVTLAAWEPDECFEVGGGPGAGQARSAPLCALCLLPAMPMGGLGAGSSEDGGAVSSLWKGGLWHVNCANFWARHTVGLLADLGLADPFA